MKNLSSSNTALSLICQWWLCDEAEHEPVVQTLAMREGQQAHSVLEAHILFKPIPQLDLPLAAKERVQRKIDAWYKWVDEGGMRIEPPAVCSWRPEVALAYDVRSCEARELPAQDPSQPWKRYASVDRAGEMTLVCDVVTEGEDLDGPFVEVIDWKFGRPNPGKDKMQVKAGCLAVARLKGIDRAVGRVVYIREDGVGPIFRDEYDAFDLTALGSRLTRVFQDAQWGEPQSDWSAKKTLPVVGSHCKEMYCKAQKSCMKWRIENDPELRNLRERDSADHD